MRAHCLLLSHKRYKLRDTPRFIKWIPVGFRYGLIGGTTADWWAYMISLVVGDPRFIAIKSSNKWITILSFILKM
jgi:hypothetical protein